MVFGVFLWLLIALIPLQTSPEFVVREIRACCHHQITLKCSDPNSKIAIIQARYVAEHGDPPVSSSLATESKNAENVGASNAINPVHRPGSKSITLWDLDVKFAHDFMRSGNEAPQLNSPDWLQEHSALEEQRRKYRLLYPKVTPIPKIPRGLNFSSERVIEMPPYEVKFLDKETIWNEPLFPFDDSEISKSESNSVSSPFFPTSKKCMSYQLLSSTSSASFKASSKDKSGSFSEKDKEDTPAWNFQDLRAYFNHRCSGRSECNVYLLRNQLKDQDLTRVCHLMPDGRIFVKYLCYNSTSGDVYSKCNTDVRPATEGFLVNPGYPELYPGDRPCQWRLHVPQQKILFVFFDISLRGQEKSQCRDELVVSEDRTKLFSTCGDHSSAIAVLSETHRVNVTLTPISRMAFPKRGFLLYFRVIGCSTPEGPKNSYMVFRNATRAFFVCNVGYVFPDTFSRDRWLSCNPLLNTWSDSVPSCKGIRSILRIPGVEDIHRNNPAVWPVLTRKKEDVFTNYVTPILVIVTLFLINGIILICIWKQRNRLEEIENETNQEMEQIFGGSPEESTFTFPSSAGEDLWDQDDQDPTLTTLTLQDNDTPSSSTRRADLSLEPSILRGLHSFNSTSNGQANGRAGSGYTNGTILPAFNGFPRTTAV